jgi:hypothetical protein
MRLCGSRRETSDSEKADVYQANRQRRLFPKYGRSPQPSTIPMANNYRIGGRSRERTNLAQSPRSSRPLRRGGCRLGGAGVRHPSFPHPAAEFGLRLPTSKRATVESFPSLGPPKMIEHASLDRPLFGRLRLAASGSSMADAGRSPPPEDAFQLSLARPSAGSVRPKIGPSERSTESSTSATRFSSSYFGRRGKIPARAKAPNGSDAP